MVQTELVIKVKKKKSQFYVVTQPPIKTYMRTHTPHTPYTWRYSESVLLTVYKFGWIQTISLTALKTIKSWTFPDIN